MIPINTSGDISWHHYTVNYPAHEIATVVLQHTRAIEFMDAWTRFMLDHAQHQGSCFIESAAPMMHKMIVSHPVILKLEAEGASAETIEAARNSLGLQALIGFADLMVQWFNEFADGMQVIGGIFGEEAAGLSELDAGQWGARIKEQYRAKCRELLDGFVAGPDHIPANDL